MKGFLSPLWGMMFRWQLIPFHIGTEGADIFLVRKDGVGRGFLSPIFLVRKDGVGRRLSLASPRFLKQGKGGDPALL